MVTGACVMQAPFLFKIIKSPKPLFFSKQIFYANINKVKNLKKRRVIMKKLYVSIIACAGLFATNAISPNLLSEFESVKHDVVASIAEDVKDVHNDWDMVIEHIEKALYHAKTLRAAHASIEQHDEVSEAVRKTLSSKVSGKTKSKLRHYENEADNADDKAERQRKRAKHLSETLHDHLEKSVDVCKNEHADIVKAHDDAQQAVAHEDKKPKEKHSKEKMHPKKDKKTKQKKNKKK